MMNNLTLHDVGHDVLSTSLFIGMEFSPSNRVRGKIACDLFKTNPVSSRELISSWVRLVLALIGQISRTTGLSNAHLHFISPTQQFMSFAHN
jgi:hypothetical protein